MNKKKCISEKTARTVFRDGKKLSYTLEHRHVKNINLRIREDCAIHVSAPFYVKDTDIDGFIYEKWDKILKALERIQTRRDALPKPLTIDSGEKIYILGKKYTLALFEKEREEIFIKGEKICLYVRDTEDYSLKKRVLEEFLRNLCEERFSGMMKKIYPVFQKSGVPFPTLRIRKMKSRWGSMIPGKRVITLNSSLIAVPEGCVEFVIMHEFCHFIHPDHSERFYRLLSSVMPEWKDRKRELEKSPLNRMAE